MRNSFSTVIYGNLKQVKGISPFFRLFWFPRFSCIAIFNEVIPAISQLHSHARSKTPVDTRKIEDLDNAWV